MRLQRAPRCAATPLQPGHSSGARLARRSQRQGGIAWACHTLAEQPGPLQRLGRLCTAALAALTLSCSPVRSLHCRLHSVCTNCSHALCTQVSASTDSWPIFSTPSGSPQQQPGSVADTSAAELPDNTSQAGAGGPPLPGFPAG